MTQSVEKSLRAGVSNGYLFPFIDIQLESTFWVISVRNNELFVMIS